MSEGTAGIQTHVLSDAFQAALDGWILRSAVFVTFRFDPAFFEQEVLPVFFDISLSQIPQARVLHLADALRTTGPVAVYYDRGALEAGAGSPRTNFERIGIVRSTGYFHPKNVLLLVEKKVGPNDDPVAGARRLIVASMSANLTRSGWWENVEVAHIERIDRGAECSFATDLRDLLTRIRSASPPGADHSALDEVMAFARELVPAEQRISGGLLQPRLYSGNEDKTVVALHRAVHLARTNPDARILLATFSEPLAHALRLNVRRLIGNEPRVAERLEVHSMSELGLRLHQAQIGPLRLASKQDMPVFLERLAGNRLRRRCLEVISPYFDDAESVKPLCTLIDTFKPREIRVFLPKGVEGEALCSEAYWQAVKDAGAQWGQLPDDIVFLSKSRERTVHAKVYRFFDPDDRRQTFFVGSVNLTNAGFRRSGNVESGFVVEIEGARRSDWWLLTERSPPPAFYKRSEAESLADGPGARLVLRFNWTSGAAHAIWDSPKPSPVLTLQGSGSV